MIFTYFRNTAKCSTWRGHRHRRECLKSFSAPFPTIEIELQRLLPRHLLAEPYGHFNFTLSYFIRMEYDNDIWVIFRHWHTHEYRLYRYRHATPQPHSAASDGGEYLSTMQPYGPPTASLTKIRYRASISRHERVSSFFDHFISRPHLSSWRYSRHCHLTLHYSSWPQMLSPLSWILERTSFCNDFIAASVSAFAFPHSFSELLLHFPIFFSLFLKFPF